jgi:hypothetical protein
MPGTRSGRRRHGRRGQDFDEDSRSSSTSEYRSVDDDDDDEEEELEEQEAEEGESAYDGSVAEEEEGPGRSGLRGRRSKKKKVPRSSSSAPPSKTRRGGGGAAAGASPGSPVAASGAAKREKEEGRPGGAGARARGALQSEGRRTAAGGYSHTVESRLAISRANRGNTPWNKGKSRSEEDVAKIRAGVRARNNLVAKRRRDAYGLSASDDQRLRKQTKYWRERVRRARVDNDRRQEIRAENLRQWQAVEAGLVAAGRRGGRKRPPAPSGSEGSSEEGGNEERDHEEDSSGEGGGDDDDEKDEGGGAAASTGDRGDGDGHRSDPHEQQLQQQEQERLEQKDRPLVSDDPVSWTPHPLDAVRDPSEVCPGGGPGGLACCPACWSLSARYLVATAGELYVLWTRMRRHRHRVLPRLGASRLTPPLPLLVFFPCPRSSSSVVLMKRTAADLVGGTGGRPAPGGLGGAVALAGANVEVDPPDPRKGERRVRDPGALPQRQRRPQAGAGGGTSSSSTGSGNCRPRAAPPQGPASPGLLRGVGRRRRRRAAVPAPRGGPDA